MRALSAIVASGLCLFLLAACSNTRSPPVGRWEGCYDAPDAMVVIRLEISPKGEIFLSAPDAVDIENVPPEEKPAMREKLATELVAGWNGVEARALDFDGHVFRKPGGFAPQLEWNSETKQMTAVLYFGMHSALRVPLHTVVQFSANPW